MVRWVDRLNLPLKFYLKLYLKLNFYLVHCFQLIHLRSKMELVLSLQQACFLRGMDLLSCEALALSLLLSPTCMRHGYLTVQCPLLSQLD